MDHRLPRGKKMVFTHPKSEEDHTPASSKFTPALSLQFRFGARNI